MLHQGSCFGATYSSNRHILALENDAKLLDEVLKPLQTLQLILTVLILLPPYQPKSMAHMRGWTNRHYYDDVAFLK